MKPVPPISQVILSKEEFDAIVREADVGAMAMMLDPGMSLVRNEDGTWAVSVRGMPLRICLTAADALRSAVALA